MKRKFYTCLKRLGHFQAQVFLSVLFVIVLVPYALVLKLFVRSFLPRGDWTPVDNQPQNLDDLRRSY